MARCATCSTAILFGGKRHGMRRYCSAKCLAKDAIGIAAQQVPAELLAERVAEVHRGSCPVCKGPGPVDVHVSHRAISFLIATSWSSRPLVACRNCGQRQKVKDALFSLAFGWWGLPWGLLVTPVQVLNDLFGLFGGPDTSRPSTLLEETMRRVLAAEALAMDGGPPSGGGAPVAPPASRRRELVAN
jgi:hypothetical protein